MRIAKIALEGFRCFAERTEIRVGDITTLVGKNDSGKSSILHALEIFFNGSPDQEDLTKGAGQGCALSIEVSFSDLPEALELEDGVPTTLSSENLLDEEGLLTIRKTFTPDSLSKKTKKPAESIIAQDFEDDQFSNLCSLKEPELNKRGQTYHLDFKKSGRAITNKDKREVLREVANKRGIQKSRRQLEKVERVLNRIGPYLPQFTLFPADYRLSEEETTFQSKFKEVVETAVHDIEGRDLIERGLTERIDNEVQKIHSLLKEHTDEVASMRPDPSFSWKDLVKFRIECTDAQGQAIAFGKRGSGLRRLLMVAYFQYLAQRRSEGLEIHGRIFAVEEPETYLHPGAQRVLLSSFAEIAREGQVLISSHSPVFAGSTDQQNLVLVRRQDGVGEILQGTALDLVELARELGVEPCDRIIGYRACVFVEGEGDVKFLTRASKLLKNAGRIDRTLDEARIGLIPLGGKDSLQHWVARKALRNLSVRYGVLIDSDKESPDQPIDQKKRNWEASCKAEGGVFFITKKREIENYLHPDAVKRVCRDPSPDCGDFTDLKKFNKEVINAIGLMTADQLLERDKYMDNGAERHEMLDIVQAFLRLPEQGG